MTGPAALRSGGWPGVTAAAAVIVAAGLLAACTGGGSTPAGKSSAGSTPSNPHVPTASRNSNDPPLPTSVTASGGSGTTAPAGGLEGASTAATGSCKLTSTPTVQGAFGGSVVSEVAMATGIGNPQCVFTLKSSNVGPGGTVTVNRSDDGTAASFAGAKKAAPGAQTITGVGDSAFLVPDAVELRFIRGHSVVSITASLRVPGVAQPKPDQLKSDLESLGKSIAALL